MTDELCQVCHRPPSEHGENPLAHVYFALSNDGAILKIGHSTNVADRLVSLARQHPDRSPLYLVGIIPGAVKEERAQQSKFSDCCLGGEWFAVSDAMSAYVKGRPADILARAVISADHLGHLNLCREGVSANENADIARLLRLYAAQRRTVEKLCAWPACSKPILTIAVGKYCSDRCRHAAYRARKRATKEEAAAVTREG